MTRTTRSHALSQPDCRLGLVLVLAMTGGLAYLAHRRQVRSDLGEGVWHQAPTDTTKPVL